MSETPIEPTRNGKQPVDRNGNLICGKPGRSGAPKENRNGMRHGLRAGKLPIKCAYIYNRINALRRQIEDAVIALRGEVSITDAANINSAIKWERHGLLSAHWLRHEVEKLSPMERLKFSETIAKASDNRYKALSMLKLDAPPPNPWEAIEVHRADDSPANLEDK